MAKIGEGHLEGMVRKGLTEFCQYLPALNNAGTNIVEYQGVWPNKTPGEISAAREGAGQGMDQEGKSTLDELRGYAAEKQKEAEQKMEKDGPEKDRGLEM